MSGFLQWSTSISLCIIIHFFQMTWTRDWYRFSGIESKQVGFDFAICSVRYLHMYVATVIINKKPTSELFIFHKNVQYFIYYAVFRLKEMNAQSIQNCLMQLCMYVCMYESTYIVKLNCRVYKRQCVAFCWLAAPFHLLYHALTNKSNFAIDR